MRHQGGAVLDAVQAQEKLFPVSAALTEDQSVLKKEEEYVFEAAIHQNLAIIQNTGSENSASSFNLFIPCVCSGQIHSVYWNKPDLISVLSVEENSGFQSKFSLILPFLPCCFCLFTEPVICPGQRLGFAYFSEEQCPSRML